MTPVRSISWTHPHRWTRWVTDCDVLQVWKPGVGVGSLVGCVVTLAGRQARSARFDLHDGLLERIFTANPVSTFDEMNA